MQRLAMHRLMHTPHWILSTERQVQSTGKKKLNASDGECIINSQGGVGTMGNFGDVSKSRVVTGATLMCSCRWCLSVFNAGDWARVVTSVKCVATGSKVHHTSHSSF